MSALSGFAALIIHAVLVLAAAPALAGLLARLGARLAGRSGPDLLQPWRDLRRLARKQPVVPESASPLFVAVPGAVLALNAAAALLVPSFTTGMLTGPLSDLLVVAGLLAASRAVLGLAALDAGTALAGIGASRTSLLTALAAPALLLVVLVVAGSAGNSNLDLAAAGLRDAGFAPRTPLLLAIPALALAAFALQTEAAGQEPAMGLAAARLEYSGRHLAALELAAWLARITWLGVIADLACPYGLAGVDWGLAAWVAGVALWAVKLLVLGAGLAVLQALAGVPAPGRLPAWLGLATMLALLAAIFLVIGTDNV
jgi:formate hydrogenlyase subunit 4